MVAMRPYNPTSTTASRPVSVTANISNRVHLDTIRFIASGAVKFAVMAWVIAVGFKAVTQ